VEADNFILKCGTEIDEILMLHYPDFNAHPSKNKYRL
jgi:hypothetical protein